MVKLKFSLTNSLRIEEVLKGNYLEINFLPENCFVQLIFKC